MRGVVAAALAPMRGDLGVDHRAFAAHCRRLLDDGCHGLAIFGTTGEANSLSVRERVDALLVLPPFYYKDVSDDGLFRFFAELVERVGDPRLRLQLRLYHIPRLAGAGFSVELLARLLEAYPGVVVGTKDSAGDGARIERVCRELPGLDVFAGSEGLLIDTLGWGGAGCISPTCNVTARLARDVHDHHLAGRRDEAATAQARLAEVRSAIEARPPLIPTLKGMMAALTGEDDWRFLRPPLDPPDRTAGHELASLCAPG